jgi:hypothetical protein
MKTDHYESFQLTNLLAQSLISRSRPSNHQFYHVFKFITTPQRRLQVGFDGFGLSSLFSEPLRPNFMRQPISMNFG